MTEHRDVREALELASVEPGGLDRLESGDAPGAAVVAGHLAACPGCLEELARLRRADSILRPILAAVPDPALRERTLALVRAVGVTRDAESTPVSVEPPPAAAPGPAVPRRRVAAAGWIGAVAAALVIGVLGGTLLVGSGAPAGNEDTATAFAAVARETATLLAAGDAREVVLVDSGGAPAGTMVASPSAGRVVVTATRLDVPPRGSEYRCWVEVGGSRRVLGAMWWAGEVAWWAGDVAIPADLPPGVVYGVSLVEEGAPGPGTVVLTGAL